MKLCLLLATGVVWAQSNTSTYTTDINGNRVESRSVTATDGLRTQLSQSINGDKVPLEQSEEKILRDDSSGKVTERIIRKFDQTGRQTSTERVLIEEQKRPDGLHVEQTTFRSDVNGNMARAEQRTSDTRTSGNTSTTETVIARPNINGSFETDEKRSRVVETAGDRKQANETVQRRGEGGQFYDAVRDVTVTEKTGSGTKETTARYEPGVTGQMELASQEVSTTSKRPDGSQVVEVDLFAPAVEGRAQERGATQQIKEQQVIERRQAADGSVVESLSVRRPSLADANKLGPAQKVSETVCKGKCEVAKP